MDGDSASSTRTYESGTRSAHQTVQNIAGTRNALQDTTPRPHVHTAPLTAEDWRLAQRTRVNLLLTGFDSVSEQVVIEAILSAGEPVTCWRPGERLPLPFVGRIGTLVLYDVGGLRRDEQHRLFDWLQGPGRTRVISTSATTLLPLVEVDAFLPELYYRLNTVCLEPLD